MPSFNVIRLQSGPKAGQLWVLPVRKSGKLRLRAQLLLCNVGYEAAYWYARGIAVGEGGNVAGLAKTTTHCSPGRSKYWKNYLSGTQWDIDPDQGHTSYRGHRGEDFHADG